ncbi:unnamed protein product, partial [Rotaria sordida]
MSSSIFSDGSSKIKTSIQHINSLDEA